MGYEKPQRAVFINVSDHCKFRYSDIGPQNGDFHPHTIFLTEEGLYELIFGSTLPAAKTFRRWVFSEVLPSIRKTGSYSMNGFCNALSGMTLNVLSNNDGEQLTEYKTILKTHLNMLKNPVAVERGQRGGLNSQENRRKLINDVRELRGRINALSGLVSKAIDVVTEYKHTEDYLKRKK